jgi:hypothetical protein
VSSIHINIQEGPMRFMMFIIPNTTAEDWTPTPEVVAAMGRYNQELTQAGVLISLDGLHPVTEAARVSFSGGSPTVTDGPFTEAKEVIGGYWMIQARSREEAVEWARRCPALDGDMIEVRQIQEFDEFPPELRAAAESGQHPA